MADNAAASAAANLCVKNKYVGMWSTLEKKTTSINFGKRKSKIKKNTYRYILEWYNKLGTLVGIIKLN